ncbi:MAG: hypothetical protein ACREIS_08740, partial [Nitrospiraceae bacterium]
MVTRHVALITLTVILTAARAVDSLRCTRPRRTGAASRICASVLALLCSSDLLLSPVTFAVSMVNDPNGFQGIPWEAPLPESPDWIPTGSGDRIREFERKQGPPRLGDATVESLRYVTIDGKFARVAVRYQGRAAHQQIMSYLEGQFGPIDRTPGQVAGGFLQQFN